MLLKSSETTLSLMLLIIVVSSFKTQDSSIEYVFGELLSGVLKSISTRVFSKIILILNLFDRMILLTKTVKTFVSTFDLSSVVTKLLSVKVDDSMMNLVTSTVFNFNINSLYVILVLMFKLLLSIGSV